MTLHLEMDTEMFDTLDAAKAEELAESLGARVYTWKTIGKRNWLELGYSRVDAIGLVVLPALLSDTIQMCDDEEEE